MFPASGPPPGMAPPMQHLGMGTSPFGMGGPLLSPSIGGAHFRPPLPLPVQQLQLPTSVPQSQFFAPPTSQDHTPKAAFGFDSTTTHEDMQLDDGDEDQEPSGTRDDNRGAGGGALDVKQQGSDAMQGERFRAQEHVDSGESEHVGFEDSEHLDSGHPEHRRFDSRGGNDDPSVEPPQSNKGKSDKHKTSSHVGSPVLSPDDFQMSDNEERNIHIDSEHHVSEGDEENEMSERPPQNSKS